jgi:serine phosphatase RsbU (regulator of sigma subunit)
VPLLFVRPSIGPLNVSTAEAGPIELTTSVSVLMIVCGSPTRPTIEIIASSAGKIERTAYTDLIESARRRKPTTAAAEVQYHLLPPRIARITGAQLAGGLLPAYEVGGDWFDFVENRDGAWLAIADASGTGPTAAGLGASALGALRAARRSGQGLEEAAQSMDEVIRALGNPQFTLTAILARWHAPTSKLTWINCGHPPGFIADPEGALTELEGPVHAALGAVSGAREFELTTVRLESADRLVLITDGITERDVTGGGKFGVDGLRRAVREASAPTAAATAMTIQHAVTSSWTEPLADDATLVVLAVD